MVKKSKGGVTVKAESSKTKKSTAKFIDETIKKSGVLKAISDFVMIGIRARINPSTGKNFKALKKSTVKYREYVAEYNPTHPNYSAEVSNLTLSGEFVDSIKAEIHVEEKLITIQPEGNHPGYFGKKGTPTRKNQPLMMDIAKGQAENGRNILKMNKKMKKQIVEIAKRRIEEEINK